MLQIPVYLADVRAVTRDGPFAGCHCLQAQAARTEKLYVQLKRLQKGAMATSDHTVTPEALSKVSKISVGPMAFMLQFPGPVNESIVSPLLDLAPGLREADRCEARRQRRRLSLSLSPLASHRAVISRVFCGGSSACAESTFSRSAR